MLSPWLRERLRVSGCGGPPMGRLERFYEEMGRKRGNGGLRGTVKCLKGSRSIRGSRRSSHLPS
jgi:hypothetical protein